MQRRAAARGEAYDPPVYEQIIKDELDLDGSIEKKKLTAARKLTKELQQIETNEDLKAKERRASRRKAEAIASEESGCSTKELLDWYTEYGESCMKSEILDDKEDKEPEKKQNGTKSKPCILFVGQLSYVTTKDDLFQHVKKELGKDHSVTEKNVKIRVLTDPKTKKSRGMAFIETDDPELLYACLKLHQTFLKGRRINVERSAGGKKNSESRKAKIKGYREEQDKYMSDAVEQMIAEFVKSREIQEGELDEGAVRLCKRHSASTVESALTRYLETNGRDMDNPSAYFMCLIGKIAAEGVHEGVNRFKRSNDRPASHKRSNDETDKKDNSIGSNVVSRSKFAKSGIDMSISDEKGNDLAQVFPSMKRGRGRSGRSYY